MCVSMFSKKRVFVLGRFLAQTLRGRAVAAVVVVVVVGAAKGAFVGASSTVLRWEEAKKKCVAISRKCLHVDTNRMSAKSLGRIATYDAKSAGYGGPCAGAAAAAACALSMCARASATSAPARRCVCMSASAWRCTARMPSAWRRGGSGGAALCCCCCCTHHRCVSTAAPNPAAVAPTTVSTRPSRASLIPPVAHTHPRSPFVIAAYQHHHLAGRLSDLSHGGREREKGEREREREAGFNACDRTTSDSRSPCAQQRPRQRQPCGSRSGGA